ncbi:uncharacterized protein METZ01_LOCUS129045 [marine metagenome]|uniref:Uncharacterized protein n=1 Tax=marine metagenome TaxID=408172 RepID=A0A381YI14_9ZZZZ
MKIKNKARMILAPELISGSIST